MTTFYRLLTGQDNSDFCHKVTLALSKGWKHFGDPQYNYDSQSSEMRCAQAVVKNISQDKNADMKLGDQ